MSTPKTLEEQLLTAAIKSLAAFSSRGTDVLEYQLQALESAASRLGGFDLSRYHRAFGISPVASPTDLAKIGERLVNDIKGSGIPHALALSALAREKLEASAKRNTGAYHTDFRLALHLAGEALKNAPAPARVIDTACGTGILLAALVQMSCGADRNKSTEWLCNRIYATDLSKVSLRGARLALSSFTSDVEAIKEMAKHWRAHDSLMAEEGIWNQMAPGGFDLVIGNPPWEKVKTTRHEFLQASGEVRHYGADYENLDGRAYAEVQKASGHYASELSQRFDYAKGEVDLYLAFLEMSIKMTRKGGRTAMLVPAGLIRAQRSEHLRRFVFESSSEVSITVLENRARFFAIDTRFKFLALTCDKRQSSTKVRQPALVLKHARGTKSGVAEICRATIGRKSLTEVRPDLSVPEVHGAPEWSLFLKMSRNGVSWDTPGLHWKPDIVREVDMTRDRNLFQSRDQGGAPLVEGRMVQQHRFGAKAYVSGTGRSALWEPLPTGHSMIRSQFYIDPARLKPKVRERMNQSRAGFCDITGQTNERSMMAALLPPGVVCGNKVPTVTFPDDPTEEKLLLWVGIVNSLPFDWLMRQVVTTTVNYFVLLGVPLPNIAKTSLPGRQIIEATRRLRQIDMGLVASTAQEIGTLRAKIDTAVAVAYGASFEDVELMLENFPLLDRGQPPLPGEAVSTITKDLILLAASNRARKASKALGERVDKALAIGACPYVPAEHVSDTADGEVTSA